MADIIFYEKPGCINNTRQKNLLLNAGHQVDSRNLLTEKWDRPTLLKYFGSMPVSLCFNSSAPEIKSGKINPFRIRSDEALHMMIDNPILIRRPLMRVGDVYNIGFELELVDQWIGLSEKDLLEMSGNKELQECPRQSGEDCKFAGE